MTPATLVSIVPFEINEFKPGLVPARFTLAASKNNIPVLLPITKVEGMVYIGSDRGSLMVPKDPVTIAASICFDYFQSSLYAEEGAKPGLFFLSGLVTPVQVDNSAELASAKEQQQNWFVRQVKIADDEWAKHHQHRVITDPQRYAARYLGLDREWLLDVDALQSKKCVACHSYIPSNAPVCKFCKSIVDQKLYKELNLVSVEK